MEDKTTPRPWRVEDRRAAPLPNIRLLGADDEQIGQVSHVHMRDKMTRWRPEFEGQPYEKRYWKPSDADSLDAVGLANAAHIVRCVNGWDALVEAVNALLTAKHCPNCPDQGWYADGPTDDPEQVQCEWCECVEDSLFKAKAKAAAALQAAEEELVA